MSFEYEPEAVRQNSNIWSRTVRDETDIAGRGADTEPFRKCCCSCRSKRIAYSQRGIVFTEYINHYTRKSTYLCRSSHYPPYVINIHGIWWWVQVTTHLGQLVRICRNLRILTAPNVQYFIERSIGACPLTLPPSLPFRVRRNQAHAPVRRIMLGCGAIVEVRRWELSATVHVSRRRGRQTHTHTQNINKNRNNKF